MRIAPLNFVLFMVIGVIAVLALGFTLLARDAEAGKNVTTEQAAAQAGAKVTPTEPKSRIEPK